MNKVNKLNDERRLPRFDSCQGGRRSPTLGFCQGERRPPSENSGGTAFPLQNITEYMYMYLSVATGTFFVTQLTQVSVLRKFCI